MKVFRNRAEAEAAGFTVQGNRAYVPHDGAGVRGAAVGIVRTDLEAQQNEVLEAVEWGGVNGGCPSCGGLSPYDHKKRCYPPKRHADDCKLSLALKAFRGESCPAAPRSSHWQEELIKGLHDAQARHDR